MPCADVPARPRNADGTSTGAQIGQWALDLLDIYGQCKGRHSALAQAVEASK